MQPHVAPCTLQESLNDAVILMTAGGAVRVQEKGHDDIPVQVSGRELKTRLTIVL